MSESFLPKPDESYERRYRSTVWFVEHRYFLGRLSIVIWVLVSSLFSVFFLWTMIDSFIISYDKEQVSVAEMAQGAGVGVHRSSIKTAALPLQLGSVSLLSTGSGRYDCVVPLTNQNTDWYATVRYHFVAGPVKTETMETTVLPVSSKPLMALGMVSTQPLSQAQIELDSVSWHRVDHHRFGTYARFAQERLQLLITETTFRPEVQIETKKIGRVSFRVQNASSYGLYEPTFLIVLKRGSTIVGANKVTLSSLAAAEVRDVDVNWFGPLPSVTSVEVTPDINILDDRVYIPL